MCQLSGLSRASLYRQPRRQSEWEMNLRNALHESALENPFYGYRRLTPELKQHGWQVGETRIRRLMREDNLLRLRKRRTKKTTDSTHGLRVYPNLACDFTPTGLNQLWAADITYIRLGHEFVYAAVGKLDNWGKWGIHLTQVAPRRCGLVDPWTPAHCTQNAPWGARRRSAGNWATRLRFGPIKDYARAMAIAGLETWCYRQAFPGAANGQPQYVVVT